MSRLKHNVIANYAGGIWTALMGIAFVPLYIHYLGIEAFGLIGVYIALQAWFIVIDMGFTPSLNREMARFDAGGISAHQARQLIKTLEVIYCGTTLFFLLLIAILSPYIATHWLIVEKLDYSTVENALIIMGATIGLRWFSTLYRGAMMGLQRQVWLSGNNAVFATLRGPGVILVLAYIDASVEAFFISQGALFVIECLVLRFKLNRLLPAVGKVGFSFDAIRRIWRFSAGVAGVSVLGALLSQLDKILLSALMPLSVLGYYTLASTVAGSLGALVAPVTNAAFPRFTELMSGKQLASLGTAYRELTQLLAAVIIPAACVIAVFASHLLLLWTRDPLITQNTSHILSILILGSMLNGIMHLPYNLQLASGWTRLMFMTNLAAIIVYVPLVYFGIQYLGVVAPAIFWLVLNLAYVLIVIPLMHRVLLKDERLAWYRDALVLPLLASVIVVAIAKFLAPPPSTDDTIRDLLLLVVVSLFSLFAAVLATPLGRDRWNGIVRNIRQWI